MAKFNGLFGKLRGKYGGGVFAVTKGQNIFREYNGQPANPRSYAQQAQRALLANMTKFYKRGTQNFYKFAFEDRTTRESDYNAFARNNMQQGVYFTKQIYDNPACPALGNFILTKGSISHSLKVVVMGDHAILLPKLSTAITTIGQLASIIISSQPNLQVGDIFTLVIAESDLQPGNTLYSSIPPTWVTIQFYLDPNDTTLLTAVGLTCEEEATSGNGYFIHTDINAVDRASFAALTISRPTDSGLKVSNTEMALSPAAAVLIDWNRGEYAKRECAVSWGGNPEAFLAGGQLDTLPNLSNITVGPNNNTPYAYGFGRFAMPATGIQIGATLAGTSLRTTAQGADYKMYVYDATAYDIDIYAIAYSPRQVIDLEGTGTATSISLSGTREWGDEGSITIDSQVYGLLTCDGVPVWWGLMLPAQG